MVYRRDLLSLRYYPPLAETQIKVGARTVDVAETEHDIPVVLVPPLAASTLIFDLLPQRSLVRFLRAHGFAVYLVDWGEPEREDSHLGVHDYALEMLPEALAQVRRHSGQQEISLFGYCMGGLFCLIYAGVARDAAIRNMVTVASPIDMHDSTIAARALILLNTPARLIRRYTPFRIHHIDPKYLHVPGWANSLAFKLANPVGSLTTYWDLLRNLSDRDYVEAHSTTRHWLDHMLDYPGALVQDFFVKLWIDNDLASGRIRIGDIESDFQRIDCSLLAIAGESDTLVGRASVRKLLDLVASRDTAYATAPGGHAGVFAGSSAPENSWALAVQWLAERSD